MKLYLTLVASLAVATAAGVQAAQPATPGGDGARPVPQQPAAVQGVWRQLSPEQRAVLREQVRQAGRRP